MLQEGEPALFTY